MAEYISREAFKARIREQQKKCANPDEIAAFTVFSFLLQAVDEEPAADVQPVKHGRWIKCDYKRLDDAGEVQTYIGQGVYCSKCRTGFHKNEVKNWIGCPCCLTRMDGDTNG